MIFLTVGTHEPFQRLVRAVDAWCAAYGTMQQVFGQITTPADAKDAPQNFDWVARLTPTQFAERFAQADLIVSHAGMGTIISALQAGKPIVVLPRRGNLGETRNDHQYATAKKLAGRPGIYVAEDENQFALTLNLALSQLHDTNTPKISGFADAEFTSSLRNFILSSKKN